MAKLPVVAAPDPTLEAVDREIEAKENARPRRRYLGMSSIGRPCSRALWYDYRWAVPTHFDAKAHKRFADGHAGEDVQADRLRLVPGVSLLTVDPETGRQFGYVDHHGHFRGHADGQIIGLIQDPDEPYVWEHKQVGDDKQSKLAKLKAMDEASALQQWDETYFSQAQLYMAYSGIPRHYLTCADAGGRNTISVTTQLDEGVAEALRAKALRIIEAERPPEKISRDPSWYQCRWCDAKGLCHGDAFAQRNCRTCIHSSPSAGGFWNCNKWDSTIPVEVEAKGCEEHRYIPDLVQGEQIDAAPDASFIVYRLTGGDTWVDGVKPE